MKGLRLSVYTNPLYKGCSLGGISDRCGEVTLVGEGIPEIFDVTDDAPAVTLRKRAIGGEAVLHVEPIGAKPMEYMAGGAFVASSDARFGAAIRDLGHSGYCAISLHDRKER